MFGIKNGNTKKNNNLHQRKKKNLQPFHSHSSTSLAQQTHQKMAPKRSKNQLRREKLKQRKLEEKQSTDTKKDEEIPKEKPTVEPVKTTTSKKDPTTTPNLTIDISTDTALFEQYQSILNKFNNHQEQEQQLSEEGSKKSLRSIVHQNSNSQSSESSEEDKSDDDDDDDEDDEDIDLPKQLSKRQLRIQNKIPLGELKAYSKFPQIVDIHDVDSKDPYLLVTIKSQPNIVPVPSNWSSKRDYLSSKKGIEKLPFQLPKFIQDTGISEMRSNTNDNSNSLKQQMRQKVQPKMGKLDMDYEKLYQAFYKFQTKPKLLFPFGDIYQEGKESNDEKLEKILKIKPGIVSKNLRIALGMPTNDINDLNTIAPAWITIMKDIGKPPTYRELIIPGLDIGYSNTGYKDQHADSKRSNFKHWGKLNGMLESDDEDEDEDEQEEEEEEEEEEKEEDEKEEEEKEEVVEEEDKETDQKEPSLNEILNGLTTGTKDKTTVVSSSSSSSSTTKQDKKLYKVLHETKLNSEDSITTYSYDLNDQHQQHQQNPPTQQEGKNVNDHDSSNKQEDEEFKF